MCANRLCIGTKSTPTREAWDGPQDRPSTTVLLPLAQRFTCSGVCLCRSPVDACRSGRILGGAGSESKRYYDYRAFSQLALTDMIACRPISEFSTLTRSHGASCLQSILDDCCREVPEVRLDASCDRGKAEDKMGFSGMQPRCVCSVDLFRHFRAVVVLNAREQRPLRPWLAALSTSWAVSTALGFATDRQ